jgi:hypothetical protein
MWSDFKVFTFYRDCSLNPCWQERGGSQEMESRVCPTFLAAYRLCHMEMFDIPCCDNVLRIIEDIKTKSLDVSGGMVKKKCLFKQNA